jgi:cytochrome c-type biogenesis protein CcmH
MRMKARVGLLSVLLAAAPEFIAAQEASPGLSEETKAILGNPEEEGGLDAGIVAVLGQPKDKVPSERLAGERSQDIASKLRCPVCQGVAIADSPSGLAVKMRGQVRDLVNLGYSEEQVMSYFERSYGEFVRLEPPLRGLNVMLWILPGFVLLMGAAFVFRKARAPLAATPAPAGPVSEAPRSDIDPELAKYLERIRRDSGTSS